MRSRVFFVACAFASGSLLTAPVTAREQHAAGAPAGSANVPALGEPRPALRTAATSRPAGAPSKPPTAPAARSAPVRSAGSRTAAAAGSRTTSIQGAAWRSDNSPVARALLRLRNLATGEIQATTIASDTGNFVFNGIPDGSYVIELVNQGGKVMMVGQTLTVGPGETVATFVRLGPKVPWFNGFFGNAAQTVSSTAASTGVTAIAPEAIPPVSSAR